MAIKIYSKDECAPDALDCLQWLAQETKITVDFLKHPHIETIDEFNQDRTRYFCINGQHYKIEYSCGVFETLYTITLQEVTEEISKAAQRLNNPEY